MNQQQDQRERGLRLLSCALFEYHLTQHVSPFLAVALGRQGVTDIASLYYDLMAEAAQATKH